MRIVLIALFSYFLISSWNKNDAAVVAQEAEMRIENRRVSCFMGDLTSCYLVQEGNMIGTDRWNLFYDQIEGFEYQDGYRYDLKVKIEETEEPHKDSFNKKYTLVKVLAKVPVDEASEIFLSSATN
ncbi:hypothetical protein D770_03995 [Flammeovirgaceae bacterium 311]|nr:hypothetical protein D770_03995 [Flammeovirgaceae bacterium 311]